MTVPGGGTSYRKAWTSVPQMAEYLILTSSSPGPGSGVGISSTLSDCLPLYTAALIVPS